MNCFDPPFEIGSSYEKLVLQPAADSKAMPIAAKSQAVIAPAIASITSRPELTFTSQPIHPAENSQSHNPRKVQTFDKDRFRKDLRSDLTAMLGGIARGFKESEEINESPQRLPRQVKHSQSSFLEEIEPDNRLTTRGERSFNKERFRQDLRSDLTAMLQGIENGFKEKESPPSSKTQDSDTLFTSLDNLSAPQKGLLVASAIALQWGLSYIHTPVQVTIPKAPSSLLSRIGLTPTNVAIVAVAAVAYKVLKPKVEALTSAYTTWKPRIDAAKSWFNWFNS